MSAFSATSCSRRTRPVDLASASPARVHMARLAQHTVSPQMCTFCVSLAPGVQCQAVQMLSAMLQALDQTDGCPWLSLPIGLTSVAQYEEIIPPFHHIARNAGVRAPEANTSEPGQPGETHSAESFQRVPRRCAPASVFPLHPQARPSQKPAENRYHAMAHFV